MIDACDEQRRPPLSVRGIGSGFSNSRGSHGVDSATDRSDKDRRVGFFSVKVQQIRTGDSIRGKNLEISSSPFGWREASFCFCRRTRSNDSIITFSFGARQISLLYIRGRG